MQTDGNNCGRCDSVCLSPQTCQGGSCGCPGGQTTCGATCVNTQTDPGNCGGCGNVVPEHNPTKSYVITPSSDLRYCAVTLNLTGLAGCTSYRAEFWGSAFGDGRFGSKQGADLTLDPTDVSGSTQFQSAWVTGGSVDIRINGVATGWQPVNC
jgi:hypothetical protein